MPNVEYDETVRRAFPLLSDTAKGDVTVIGKRLARDAYYLPSEDPELEGADLARPYLCERFADGSGAVCWKLTDWDGWRLSWYFEFATSLSARVENVVLQLYLEPSQLSVLPATYVPGRRVSAKVLEALKGLRVW